MTPTVAAVVLFAAITHAGWNAIAHTLRDELAGLTLVGVGRVLCGLVGVLLLPLPAAGAWPYLLASVVLHVVYQVLLMRSFSVADFGQAYPIARGTAPLLVTAVAVLVLDDPLTGTQLIGVVVTAAGLLFLALWGLRGAGGRMRGGAVGVAVATGLAIAAYTLVDGVGVREAGVTAAYIAWLMLLDGIAIPLYAVAVKREGLLARLRPVLWRGLLGGVMSVTAYGLVLWAQSRAPLAPVAVLRETSIIVGALIATIAFRERFGVPRLVASAVMLVGIALMLR